MLKGDADAIKMCNIAGLRDIVGDAEPFLKVGYIDVGGVAEEGTDAGLGLVVFEGHMAEAAEASGDPNKGTEGGDKFRVDESGTSDEDSEDPEYMPSDEEGDSAGDVHFTDSEEEYKYDSKFDEDNSVPKEATSGKGKGVGISQFSDEDGADSDELEINHMIGGDEGDDDDAEDDADDVSDRGVKGFQFINL
nr:acidic leucine-rich nuclear phosphoprotein 32 family member A-like [Arachis hypogaea]